MITKKWWLFTGFFIYTTSKVFGQIADVSSVILESSKPSLLDQNISFDYSSDRYSKFYDPTHLLLFQYGKKYEWGTGIGRLNYRKRFGKNVYQFETNLYPKIADVVYCYLNYGLSFSDLFPKHRFGAELFSSLPKSFEASLGLRYLFFDTNSDVVIYTGSIGYYYGNYWFSLRSFITPSKVSFSRSVGLTVRYYYADADEYLNFKISGGFSPDERNYDPANGSVYFLKAQTAGIGWQKPISENSILNFSFDITNQELGFSNGEYVKVYSFSAGYKYKF